MIQKFYNIEEFKNSLKCITSPKINFNRELQQINEIKTALEVVINKDKEIISQ